MKQDLAKTLERLEREIAAASSEGRIALQPRLSQVLDRLHRQGEPVPRRLQQLDAALIDEAIEAKFDNMPV